MPRRELTAAQREEGRRLARALRAARKDHGTASEVAVEAGLSIDTVRKLEGNGIASPSFFTVARLARVLGLKLDALAAEALDDS